MDVSTDDRPIGKAGYSLGEREMDERPSYLDQLTRQIDRFEKNIDVLEGRLRPVLSQHALTYAEVRPEEVAEHQLHEQMKRLENANQALETLIGRVAL